MQTANVSLFCAGKSSIHSVHPLSKLALVLLTGVAVYCAPGGIWPDVGFWVLSSVLAIWAGVAVRVWKFLFATLLPIALFMIPIHGLLYPGNQTVLATYHGISLYLEGLHFAGIVLLQLAAILSMSLLFVFTTDPADLITSLIQSGMPSSLAYVCGSPLLMLPAMRARVKTIQDAQRSRGLDSEGGLLNRAKSIAPLISPLILGAFSEIEQRAIALELRGFRSRCPRTSMRIVQDSAGQRIARVLMILVCVLLLIYKTILYRYVPN
ncbi:energy-coupling factor transporter transmembrane component T family protein [Maridesulfovibrio sp.]|uniref:energy-coupling factor transporter transmembrane component T family protein n=1 Tax=Maridesulfovibrio sp. TaxID=2795000 RepID=UPI0029F53936|nr:energy-coupling factor transporter transmembrane component T [Maridesulfovibrio sp.]